MLTLALTHAQYSNIGNAANRVVRGNVGMALLPGSTRVLDRPSRRLVPCDAKRCPLATDQALDPTVSWRDRLLAA